MLQDVTATMVMLGMPGFRVLSASEHAGELEQAVETPAEGGLVSGLWGARGCRSTTQLGSRPAGCTAG